MAKLTRTQRARAESALRNAERARDYIMASTTAVCRRGNAAGGTTLDYRREDGAMLCEVTREYGSNLCGLFDAIRDLKVLLEANA